MYLSVKRRYATPQYPPIGLRGLKPTVIIITSLREACIRKLQTLLATKD